ncbi:MAG: hypothetical protein WC343_01485 [Bacilli bacterium]|jgi:hypothetical protein
MNFIDKCLGYYLMGLLILVTSFCFGWWSFYLLNFHILYGAIIGIILGIILNVLLLKRIVNNLFNMDDIFLAIIYIAYSVFIFGFFMGVPVFNVVMGILLGWYIGRKMKLKNKSFKQFFITLRRGNLFATAVLIVICIVSASIALNDPYTASNIEGMLNLNFEVTNTMVQSVIIFGGIFLLGTQYLLIRIVAENVYLNSKNTNSINEKSN